jgi:hypothetical protein
MQLSELLIGFIAFVCVSIACLGLMVDMYNIDDSHSYQVNLSNDTDTAQLDVFRTQLESAHSSNSNSSKTIYGGLVGEPNASVTGTGNQQTQSDVWTSSLLNIANIGTYIKVSLSLITQTAGMLGFSENNIALTFITTTLILTVALTILGIVFFRPL